MCRSGEAETFLPSGFLVKNSIEVTEVIGGGHSTDDASVHHGQGDRCEEEEKIRGESVSFPPSTSRDADRLIWHAQHR